MEAGAEAEERKGAPIHPRAYLRNKQKPMGHQQGPGPGPCASGWLTAVRMSDGYGASLGIVLRRSSSLLSIPRSALRFFSLSHSESLMVVLIGPGGVFSLPGGDKLLASAGERVLSGARISRSWARRTQEERSPSPLRARREQPHSAARRSPQAPHETRREGRNMGHVRPRLRPSRRLPAGRTKRQTRPSGRSQSPLPAAAFAGAAAAGPGTTTGPETGLRPLSLRAAAGPSAAP